ncbi:MAG TPA: hypothetical protein PLZ93_01295 [Nocardioides sp.]|uniref:hypothetical protein n=1 Tax=uncultured Nocardioides sp. TaxID=198441 RepID=UPI00260655E8|nr:hypothetical protein [uncultured Nocardioides sp.]HRD62795.1 hypothetical protein [Nocardioides sp.]HRI94203.1 hypothetical protein [Nocardioides sp.]HRI94228.1 hypothetical protein [Nocardioides sp.]HRK47785.1 hypothetical protein [Nocardioides sp.]
MKPLLVRVAVAVVATASLVLGGTSSASASTHTGPNWSWSGPASWDASYGTYGITVLGDQGATLDLGFSSTLCASGATWEKSVDRYFKGLRQSLKRSGWDLTAGRITHPRGYSPTYRRQVLEGTFSKRGLRRGQIVLDYDFTTNVDGLNYCYQRSLAKYAKARSWNSMKRTLNQVQNSLAYSGPGAPGGQDPADF